MKRVISINKQIAPKDFESFKRWFSAACDSLNMTAEQGWRSLGRKVPKPKQDEDKSVKEAE